MRRIQLCEKALVFSEVSSYACVNPQNFVNEKRKKTYIYHYNASCTLYIPFLKTQILKRVISLPVTSYVVSYSCQSSKCFLFLQFFRSVRKALLSRHATIVDENEALVVNGIMVSEDWVLTLGSSTNAILQSTNPNSFRVKVGRTKGYRSIVRVFRHPLIRYGTQYNVALIRLKYKKKNPDQSCIITEKQYKILTSIFKHISITTRVKGKTKFTKLKPRRGRISKSCSKKNLICATIKNPKKGMMLMDGSPMYLGHNGDYRLAGIGMDLPAKKDHKYNFIPLWSVSEWMQTVIDEYNTKCHLNTKGVDVCADLALPTFKDMADKLRRPEHH